MSTLLPSGRTLQDQIAYEVIISDPPSGQQLSVLQVTGTPTNPILYAGIQTGTTVKTALNNGTSLPCTEVVVQAHPLTLVNVLVGIAALTPFHLTPGDSLSLPVNNVNKIFIATPSGTSVASWLAVGG